MGRKHKHPEHENHERWLVSYADFITLLFATFTALYAIATADLAKLNKVQEVAEAISQGFQDQSLVSGIKSILQGKSPPNNNPNPLSKKTGEGPGVLGKYDSLVPTKGNVHGKDPSVQELNRLMNQVNQSLKTLAGATLTLEKAGARISFDSTLLYDSGSASLKPAAQKALKLIGERLAGVAESHNVLIEGHTDNQPIRSLFYPSNWELSTARACSVVRLLLSQVDGIPAKAISAVGYADTRPKAPNTTLAGRAANRRIDIFIQGFAPVEESSLIEPGSEPGAKTSAKLPLTPPEKPSFKPVASLKPKLTETPINKTADKTQDSTPGKPGIQSVNPVKEGHGSHSSNVHSKPVHQPSQAHSSGHSEPSTVEPHATHAGHVSPVDTNHAAPTSAAGLHAGNASGNDPGFVPPRYESIDLPK